MSLYEDITDNLRKSTLATLGFFFLAHSFPLFSEINEHYLMKQDHIHLEMKISAPYQNGVVISGTTANSSYNS
jgi:hypothetical protein